MSQPQNNHHHAEPLVSDLLITALEKLGSYNVSTMSSLNANSGPLYSEWQSNNHDNDLPELSALYRLSLVLPDTAEGLVAKIFKPASLTILETKSEDLLGDCENVLKNGYLAVVRSEYDYLPKARLISTDGEVFGSLSSRRKRRNSDGLPSELISQTPTILLVVDKTSLSEIVQAAATATLSLPCLTQGEINMLYRQIHSISLQAILPNLLANLPSDEALARLKLDTVYAALRQPTASDVSEALHTAVNARNLDDVEDALDQVIGLGPARPQLEQLAEDLLSWKSGDLPWEDMTRGVLLYGQPGCGKTFCAQKLAEQCGVHFESASYAEWQRHGHLGDLLSAMTKSFKEARENAPSILFLDEIDAFGDRKTAAGDNAQYTRSVVNALLEQLDGVGKQEGVLVIGACNYPELLDDALVRSGRFDLKINMPMPDKSSLIDLMKLHLGDGFDEALLVPLAEQLVGCSGADVAALIRKARGRARQLKRGFSIADFRDVVAASTPAFSQQDLLRAAQHEAGHAVVGYISGKGKPLRARIGVQGGEVTFSMSNPLPEITGLEAEIATALAGRACEEIFYASACTGAGGSEESDLAKATNLAVSVEVAYGLGSSGLTWHPVSTDNISSLLKNQDLAERVEKRLQTALEAAKAIIVENQPLVQAIASKLVQHRELSSSELAELLDAGTQKPTSVTTLKEVPDQDMPAQSPNASS